MNYNYLVVAIGSAALLVFIVILGQRRPKI